MPPPQPPQVEADIVSTSGLHYITQKTTRKYDKRLAQRKRGISQACTRICGRVMDFHTFVPRESKAHRRDLTLEDDVNMTGTTPEARRETCSVWLMLWSLSQENMNVVLSRVERQKHAQGRECLYCLSPGEGYFQGHTLLKTPCCLQDVCVKCVEYTAMHWKNKCRTASSRTSFRLMPCILCNASWSNTPEANAVPQYKDRPFDDLLKARCCFLVLFWDITLCHMNVDKRMSFLARRPTTCTFLWDMMHAVGISMDVRYSGTSFWGPYQLSNGFLRNPQGAMPRARKRGTVFAVSVAGGGGVMLFLASCMFVCCL